MTRKINPSIKDLGDSFYKEKVQNIKTKNSVEVDLDEEQVKYLAKYIYDLPYDYLVVLKARLIYKMSPKEVEKVFSIEDPRGLYSIVVNLLSKKFFSEEEKIISEKSLTSACLLVEKIELLEANAMAHKSLDFKPSRAFKKTMKNAGLDTRKTYEKVLKRAASFIIIILGSLLVFLSFNVSAREKFFDWIIKDFGIYSTFSPEEVDPKSSDAAGVNDLRISYIPKDFELTKEKENKMVKSLWFINTNNDDLYFSITFQKLRNSSSGSMYDTEDAVLEEIYINGNKGYFWTHHANMVLWQQNNIECFIAGSISKEEVIKIAENISK